MNLGSMNVEVQRVKPGEHVPVHASRFALLTLLVLLVLLVTSMLPLSLRTEAALAHGSEVLIAGVPSVAQSYPLSCEYAAAMAVTLYWGGETISEEHFMREIPKSLNPHLGFRGDMPGEWGGITDYGVYAEALVPVLEQHGYSATVFYGGVSRLKAELAQVHPLVVWITGGRSERPVYSESYGGRSFKLVPYEHTVVAYGYDDAGIYLMDVGDGGKYYTPWDSFLLRWSYFDQMALLIHP